MQTKNYITVPNFHIAKITNITEGKKTPHFCYKILLT